MRFITLLTLLASALYASASNKASSLRGSIDDPNHLIALKGDESISVTADSPPDLQKYCIETETWWVDANGDGCDWYEDDKSRCDKAHKWVNNDLDATDVCCKCGGGKTPNSNCKNDKYWRDANGNKCSWYGNRNPKKYCGDWADDNKKGGYSANDKCCICGGSRD